jgi:pyruvate,water dikinase
MNLVTNLRALTLSDRPHVGGKAASLGELLQADIPVPPGFAILTAAFEAFLTAADPDAALRARVGGLDPADHEAIAAASAEIRSRVESAPLPADLHRDVVHAYRGLGGASGDLPVAVRSSATCEDSAEASFAGMQDTFLWVRGADQVVDRVRACWGSLFSTESISYRLRLGLPEEALGMAVVVQQMVDARCSGVMFTRSPTSGDRSVVTIEASWGLGSCIVSGEVTPDHYVVSKVTGEITKRTVAHKTMQHVPDPGGGVNAVAVDADRQTIPCLEDGEILALAALARRVERHYGSAQDIEWALARPAGTDDGIFLLQSRPETVWAARDSDPVAVPAARSFDHVISFLGGAGRQK